MHLDELSREFSLQQRVAAAPNSLRYDIADCLRDAGYAVIESESGEEALFRAGKNAGRSIITSRRL